MSLVRRHRGLALLVAAGALVRLAVAIAYEPGLFFSDSWAYAQLSDDLGFTNDRPSGYPVIVALLSLPGRSMLVLTSVQHLAGIAIGVLTYAVLERFSAPRALSLAAAALPLLDGYAIALEQHMMAETFFTLAAMLGVLLATGPDRTPMHIALAGLLLGGAVTIRSLGLFLLPAFVLFILLRRRDRRTWLVAIGAAALPLLLYSTIHAAAGKGFGMTQIEGWGIYSRVAPFAECAGAEVPRDTVGLCQRPEERFERPSSYGWDPTSPANRLLGHDRVAANERLRAWAVAIIRHQPLDYAEAVGSDFLRFFRPTERAAEGARPGDFDEPVLLPTPRDREYSSPFENVVRRRLYPDYEREIDPPAGLARDYVSVVHVPRPLMALLALVSLAALALALVRRLGPGSRAPEIVFLAGGGLLMLLAAASVEFQLRYLIPSVPLLACAGVLAIVDLRRRYARAP